MTDFAANRLNQDLARQLQLGMQTVTDQFPNIRVGLVPRNS
jgi:hypothetical protein